MAAYARVIAHLQDTDRVIIPCPADLRRFHSFPNTLTVANMTEMYRTLISEFQPKHTYTSTLTQVHIEMALQRSRCRCFLGIPFLNWTFDKLPSPLLYQIIKKTYHLPPVSYTNFEVIDSSRLIFQDCSIESCYLTGTYRTAPDFQLSISTFRDVCTLNCTLIGGEDRKSEGLVNAPAI